MCGNLVDLFKTFICVFGREGLMRMGVERGGQGRPRPPLWILKFAISLLTSW